MKLKEKQGSLETLWIIGGASIYQEVMDSENLCNRIYLTKIQSNFECDTFLPNINVKKYKEVSDDRVDQEVQEENGLKFAYKVYERQIL